MENEPAETQPSKIENHTFIIRIWREITELPGQGRMWRGLVIHVGNGERIHFHNLDTFLRFIRNQAGIGIDSAIPWWRSLLDWLQMLVKRF